MHLLEITKQIYNHVGYSIYDVGIMIVAPILNWCSRYCATHIHIWYLPQLCSNCAVVNIISHISSPPKPRQWQIADDKEFCNGNYKRYTKILCFGSGFPLIIIKFGSLWANIMAEIIPNHLLKYFAPYIYCLVHVPAMPNSLKDGNGDKRSWDCLTLKMRIAMKTTCVYWNGPGFQIRHFIWVF